MEKVVCDRCHRRISYHDKTPPTINLPLGKEKFTFSGHFYFHSDGGIKSTDEFVLCSKCWKALVKKAAEEMLKEIEDGN